MSPVVLNRRTTYDRRPGAVYVGRPSVFGNPYEIGRDGTREEVVRKFEQSLSEDFRAYVRTHLRGHDLVCWCAPEACHADVLLKIANE